MFVRSFRIRNYMIHQDTSLCLHPITVFVGPNGGGKSALFDALLNFSMVSRGRIRHAFGPFPYSYRSTVYRGTRGVPRIAYDIELSRGPENTEALRYIFDYSQTRSGEDEPGFTIHSERLLMQPEGSVLFDRSEPETFSLGRLFVVDNDRGIFPALQRADVGHDPCAIPELVSYCAQQIGRFNKFRLDPAELAAPARRPEPTAEPVGIGPVLGYHGEDLARVLYYLSETEAPELAVICRRIQEIEPTFAGFDFATVGADRIAFAVQYSDQRQSVPSVRLSSGFLTYLGLMVLVSVETRPAILMIEEPENGLTPRAVKAFYKAVRESIVTTDGVLKSQVLISSHSPFVICEAWNGEDRGFIYQVSIRDGRARVRPFAEAVEDHGTPLPADGRLTINHADYVMSDYFGDAKRPNR
jgi:predicted ATPase